MGKVIQFPKIPKEPSTTYEFDEDLGYDVLEQMLIMDLEERNKSSKL